MLKQSPDHLINGTGTRLSLPQSYPDQAGFLRETNQREESTLTQAVQQKGLVLEEAG